MLVRMNFPILEQDVKDVDVQLSDLAAKVGKVTVVQSTEDRLGLPRVRRGGERIIGLVADLSERFGVTLGDVHAKSVRFNLDYAAQLSSFELKAEAMLRAIKDTRRQTTAEAWDGALTLYRALVRMSNRVGAVQAALEPIREFLALGKRGETDEQSSAPTPPVVEDDQTDSNKK